MPLTRFEITSRVPYAGGRRFGAVGAYEQVDGTAHFAVDPIHPANARICDLKLAPRNAAGLVEFAADLIPRAAGGCLRQANGRCIVELPNRGRRRVVAMMNCAPPDAPVGPQAHPGDGFLFARGYSGSLHRLAMGRLPEPGAAVPRRTFGHGGWQAHRRRDDGRDPTKRARRRRAFSPTASTDRSRPRPGSSSTHVSSCATGRTVRTP